MLTTKITNIANAIRNKTNTTDMMTIDEMPSRIENIVSGITPILQDKSITITENGTTSIVADEGYDGLNNVEVTTNVASSGGGIPEVGVVINEWDSDGYATKITLYGMTKVPSASFNSGGILTSRLKEVRLPEGIRMIMQNAFADRDVLEKINMPDSIVNIQGHAFKNCKNLKIDKLPMELTDIGNYAFYNCTSLNVKEIPARTITLYSFNSCTSLKQLSMPNVTTISGGSSSDGAFNKCTGLKAVWIGASISGSFFYRYSFNGCTSLIKMFIDLPRATVEGFANYQYAFMNDTTKTGIIICNDDEGFMTKEEFDAIDWATYTE